MLISAYEKASKHQRELLDSMLSIDNPELRQEKINGVTDMYNELGIPELCNLKLKEYHQASLNALNAASIPDQSKSFFINFANMLMHSDK